MLQRAIGKQRLDGNEALAGLPGLFNHPNPINLTKQKSLGSLTEALV